MSHRAGKLFYDASTFDRAQVDQLEIRSTSCSDKLIEELLIVSNWYDFILKDDDKNDGFITTTGLTAAYTCSRFLTAQQKSPVYWYGALEVVWLSYSNKSITVVHQKSRRSGGRY